MSTETHDITIIYRGKFSPAVDPEQMRRDFSVAFRSGRMTSDKLIASLINLTTGSWEVVELEGDAK